MRSIAMLHSPRMFLPSLVILIFLSLCEGGAPCPSPTSLKVCTCSQMTRLDAVQGTQAADYNLTVLECKDIVVFADLEADLSQFHFKVIDKLTIRNVSPASSRRKSTRFPSTTFKNTRIRMLEILDSQISNDFVHNTHPFQDQTSLVSLKVRNCSLRGMLTTQVSVGAVIIASLRKLSKIESIDLSDNYIIYISNKAFDHFPASLTSINLSQNEIDYIERLSFETVSRLQALNLSHNVLERIERNIFPSPAGSLQVLDLGFNLLKALPDDLFINMPLLETVNVQNNYLHTVSDKSWSAVWSQLISLDLSGNVIDCDCTLVWMLKAKSAEGRHIRGKCVAHKFPFSASEYDLQTLTRAQITCSN